MSKRTPAFYDYTYKEIEPASRVSDIKIHDKNGDSKTVGVHQRKVRKIKAGSPTDQSKITPAALKCKKKKRKKFRDSECHPQDAGEPNIWGSVSVVFWFFLRYTLDTRCRGFSCAVLWENKRIQNRRGKVVQSALY